uniref:immunoglobulin iota chain-like n=1 Tax=Semicossyphus pulcher TaxID=241346 RepID=UPI0037E89D30
MIAAGLIKLSAALLCVLGLVNGSDVIQDPLLWTSEGQSATFTCKHTKDATYYQMYWYRQLPGETMKQIVFTSPNDKHQYEPGFSADKFPAKKDKAETGSLTVEKLLPGDSGVYYCSVSQHSETGRSLSKKVDQEPSSILGSPHGSATISCNHSDSLLKVILWYQQPVGSSGLELIGYIQYTNDVLEDKFKEHFKVTGDGSKKSELHVLKLRQAEDSGMRLTTEELLDYLSDLCHRYR